MNSLDETLAQFAKMLKTPVFVERAVSYFLENMKKSTNGWLELSRRLISRTANNGHPARKHAYDDMSSVETMDEHTLRPRILEFLNRHYSAHRMYVCLQTNLSLNEMQVMNCDNRPCIVNIYENNLSAAGYGRDAFLVGAD